MSSISSALSTHHFGERKIPQQQTAVYVRKLKTCHGLNLYFRLCFTVTNQDQTVHQVAAENASRCNSTESLIKHTKMHTGVQRGEVLAFASAVLEETCWIVCIMAIEALQIIFTDVSQQSDNTRVQNRGWANEQKVLCKILFRTNRC